MTNMAKSRLGAMFLPACVPSHASTIQEEMAFAFMFLSFRVGGSAANCSNMHGSALFQSPIACALRIR